MQGLDALQELQVLDVSNNHLQRIEGLDHLTQLQDLWLNDNSIACSTKELRDALKGPAGALASVYLASNPVCDAIDVHVELVAALPQLAQLDGELLQGRQSKP